MKINIDLNPKSVEEAIKRLESVKSQIKNKMVEELLVRCCEFFINRANYYISLVDVGVNVRASIENSWSYQLSGKTAKITNTSNKAVFVEFGVGIVGKDEPHPNASESGYEYDKPSDAKARAELQGFPDGTWIFYQNARDLDLPSEALDDRVIFNEPNRNSERMLIRTRGTKGAMYAYNALVDLQTFGISEIWQQITAKYWG